MCDHEWCKNQEALSWSWWQGLLLPQFPITLGLHFFFGRDRRSLRLSSAFSIVFPCPLRLSTISLNLLYIAFIYFFSSILKTLYLWVKRIILNFFTLEVSLWVTSSKSHISFLVVKRDSLLNSVSFKAQYKAFVSFALIVCAFYSCWVQEFLLRRGS